MTYGCFSGSNCPKPGSKPIDFNNEWWVVYQMESRKHPSSRLSVGHAEQTRALSWRFPRITLSLMEVLFLWKRILLTSIAIATDWNHALPFRLQLWFVTFFCKLQCEPGRWVSSLFGYWFSVPGIRMNECLFKACVWTCSERRSPIWMWPWVSAPFHSVHHFRFDCKHVYYKRISQSANRKIADICLRYWWGNETVEKEVHV